LIASEEKAYEGMSDEDREMPDWESVIKLVWSYSLSSPLILLCLFSKQSWYLTVNQAFLLTHRPSEFVLWRICFVFSDLVVEILRAKGRYTSMQQADSPTFDLDAWFEFKQVSKFFITVMTSSVLSLLIVSAIDACNTRSFVHVSSRARELNFSLNGVVSRKHECLPVYIYSAYAGA
ncbi:hypothetical protein KCU86_g84, partial [Aureobasidium melanogenum]